MLGSTLIRHQYNINMNNCTNHITDLDSKMLVSTSIRRQYNINKNNCTNHITDLDSKMLVSTLITHQSNKKASNWCWFKHLCYWVTEEYATKIFQYWYGLFDTFLAEKSTVCDGYFSLLLAWHGARLQYITHRTSVNEVKHIESNLNSLKASHTPMLMGEVWGVHLWSFYLLKGII